VTQKPGSSVPSTSVTSRKYGVPISGNIGDIGHREAIIESHRETGADEMQGEAL
jgi:hypothetical protein